MKTCIACGMPLLKAEDCAGGDLNAKSCAYCTDTNGKIKSCDEIFQGGVQFFMQETGASMAHAERITRKNMRSLPYWKNKKNACLEGPVATDAEFQEALQKLK